MSDEPKFCKDCKHYQPVPSLIQYSIYHQQNAAFSRGYETPPSPQPDWYRDFCTHPSKRSLVTGQSAEDPKMMRAGSCGPEGLLWEQKPEPEVVVTFVTGTPEYTRPEAPPQNMLHFEQPEPPQWWEFWK